MSEKPDPSRAVDTADGSTEPVQHAEPPPFDPDPDLISYLERGRKPTAKDLREIIASAGAVASPEHRLLR